LCAHWCGWYPPNIHGDGVQTFRDRSLAYRLGFRKSVLMKRLHQSNLFWFRAVRAAFGLLCLCLGFAACGNGASTGPQSWQVSSTQATSQFAIADFDGDNRPDLATVQVGHSGSWDTDYWIAFQLSRGSRQILGITAPTGGLQVTSRDVNGDSFLDVIVTTAWTNQPVAVLLNDGKGNFRASSPSAFPGAFTTSEESWALTTDEVKDGTAVLFSRYPTGNCPEGSKFSSPRNVTGLLVPGASRNSLSSAVVSFLGRAPPSFLLHI
jgi:hypothetical protein